MVLVLNLLVLVLVLKAVVLVLVFVLNLLVLVLVLVLKGLVLITTLVTCNHTTSFDLRVLQLSTVHVGLWSSFLPNCAHSTRLDERISGDRGRVNVDLYSASS